MGSSVILMLPKHRSECDLERPFQKAYFENEFGSKSIGEPSWKPHVRNALDYPDCQQHSSKGGNGLDWFSSIRCPHHLPQSKAIQSQSQTKRIDLKTSNLSQDYEPNFEITILNTVEQTTKKDKAKTQAHSQAPVLEYDETEDFTRDWELTLEKSMGRKKRSWDCRNGIKEGAPGDKSYHVPEYESKFHNYGSTLPSVCFGGLKTIPDTFIPLVKLPLKPRIPYHVKEQMKGKAREIAEVNELDNWKPAEPLRVS